MAQANAHGGPCSAMERPGRRPSAAGSGEVAPSDRSVRSRCPTGVDRIHAPGAILAAGKAGQFDHPRTSGRSGAGWRKPAQQTCCTHSRDFADGSDQAEVILTCESAISTCIQVRSRHSWAFDQTARSNSHHTPHLSAASSVTPPNVCGRVLLRYHSTPASTRSTGTMTRGSTHVVP